MTKSIEQWRYLMDMLHSSEKLMQILQMSVYRDMHELVERPIDFFADVK